MELLVGIEPTTGDYKSTVLPLNYRSKLKYGLLHSAHGEPTAFLSNLVVALHQKAPLWYLT